MFIDKETREYVNALFGLPASGDEQDWAVELSDKSRIMEFVDFMQKTDLLYSLRYAIMELIISSYDDYLYSESDDDLGIWNKIKELVSKDKSGYTNIIEYWALRNEKDENNLFNITLLVRSLHND